eukprot:GHRQ01035202.1.p2 GENE.GHRQ01035202.1~~GHRQ01035202.1.p2  ORF type:complete len:113 (-),score=21.49 GHRQ01035202.1:259-597(-)
MLVKPERQLLAALAAEEMSVVFGSCMSRRSCKPQLVPSPSHTPHSSTAPDKQHVPSASSTALQQAPCTAHQHQHHPIALASQHHQAHICSTCIFIECSWNAARRLHHCAQAA